MWIFPFTMKPEPLRTLSYTFQIDHKDGRLVGDIERRHCGLLGRADSSRDRREEFVHTRLHMTCEEDRYINYLFATVIRLLLRADTGPNAADKDDSGPLR